TVCVAFSHSGQAAQPAAASRSFFSVGREGISAAAVPSPSIWSWLTVQSYPEGGATIPARGAVAEWLGRGLQSLVHRFKSGRRLRRSKSGAAPRRDDDFDRLFGHPTTLVSRRRRSRHRRRRALPSNRLLLSRRRGTVPRMEPSA